MQHLVAKRRVRVQQYRLLAGELAAERCRLPEVLVRLVVLARQPVQEASLHQRLAGRPTPAPAQ